MNSNVIEWLKTYALGFSSLSDEEKNEIMYFSLMWSFFESQVLDESASAQKIVEKIQGLSNLERLDVFSFVNYFINRYVESNETNAKFEQLNFRSNDKEELVKKVLLSREKNVANVLSAVLIIVYRFRNNLFHGLKWVDCFRDQFQNFKISNDLMMKVMDLYKTKH